MGLRRVYWASQETVATWLPSATNTAGSFDLATEGTLVCGRKTRGATLLWTTVDLWTMTYIGGTFVFSFAKVADNCGAISAHSPVVLNTGAYWMGQGNFFVYDGFVKPIPCDVNDYVFGNFATAYAYKVWALANPQFGEVTWFYPSAVATDIDSYVTYNYLEGHWYFGTLDRTCGVTQVAGSSTSVPLMMNASGGIYDHETGTARSGNTPYLESGPVELGDGDQVMRIQRIVPDDKTAGDVSASIYTAMYPDGTETLNGPYTLASPTSVRLTARQIRLKLTEAVVGAWRVGVVRLGVIAGGRR